MNLKEHRKKLEKCRLSVDPYNNLISVLAQELQTMSISIASRKTDQNLLPFRFALKSYIEDEKLKIPVLPDVIGKVIRLINHPKADANMLARLIHKDQALAGYVLRVSNSPVYAGVRQIETLRQAITRIGAKTLGKIALSITMQGTIFKAKGYEQEITDIWRHTLTSGAYAQEIGNLIKEQSESLYLCGLLHTVGKPVILQALDELKVEFQMELSHTAGLSLMEEFHRKVGVKVAEQWKLPEAVREACHYYLEPESAESHVKEVRVTYLAHMIAQFVDEDPEPEQIVELANEPSVQALRIDQARLEKLFGKLDRVRALLEAMSLGK